MGFNLMKDVYKNHTKNEKDILDDHTVRDIELEHKIA
jgi:hypothetical protein